MTVYNYSSIIDDKEHYGNMKPDANALFWNDDGLYR